MIIPTLSFARLASFTVGQSRIAKVQFENEHFFLLNQVDKYYQSVHFQLGTNEFTFPDDPVQHYFNSTLIASCDENLTTTYYGWKVGQNDCQTFLFASVDSSAEFKIHNIDETSICIFPYPVFSKITSILSTEAAPVNVHQGLSFEEIHETNLPIIEENPFYYEYKAAPNSHSTLILKREYESSASRPCELIVWPETSKIFIEKKCSSQATVLLLRSVYAILFTIIISVIAGIAGYWKFGKKMIIADMNNPNFNPAVFARPAKNPADSK